MKSDKKILLVEDDPNFGRILKDYLTINNYEVTLAANGIEGFEKFNKSEFDLCILDIMMPFKDGLTLAKEIREVNEAIPLIFLTAKNLKDDVLGSDDIEKKIIKILDQKIRPAVAKDGGDIKFKEFKDGIVKVQLQGSCSGCPSSTMTLKQGVQNLLCHYVKEVKSVEAS